MNILHIITGLDAGGAENTLLKICKLTKTEKYKHYVISLQKKGVLLDDFKKNKIKVFSLSFNKNFSDIFEFFKIFKILKEIKPKILMTWLYHADFIGLILKIIKFKSFKLIWNIRCSDIHFENYSFITKILFFILKIFSRVPNLITFNSINGKEFHIKVGYNNRQIRVIPNFINSEIWKYNSEERIKFRNEIGIKDNEILIGNIGRFDPQKDHKTFITSAQKVLDKYKNVKFIIVGKNTHNLKINSLFKEKFIILDYQKNVKKLYSGIDLVVLSSLYGEGFSNVILEAMSMSIPCIASNVGDNAKIIDDNKLIFEAGNSADLTNKIIYFLNLDNNKKNDKKNYNREIVRKHYESNNVLNEFKKIWI